MVEIKENITCFQYMFFYIFLIISFIYMRLLSKNIPNEDERNFFIKSMEYWKKKPIWKMKSLNIQSEEPKDMEKTTAEIRHLCDSVLIIDTISDFADFTCVQNELYDCVEKLLTEMKNVKEIHAYCGNGIFLGMKRNAFGKIIKLNAIPPRSNKFPGTRFDSTV